MADVPPADRGAQDPHAPGRAAPPAPPPPPYVPPQPPYAARGPYGAVPAFIQRYPGAPPEPNPALQRQPSGPYPYPYPPYTPPAGERPKTFAVLSLIGALAGIFAVFTGPLAFASGPILIAAIVLGIIALANRRQGGKSLAIAAIILAVSGGILAWIITAIFGLGITGDLFRDDEPFIPQPIPTPDPFVPPVEGEPTDGSDGSRGTVATPYTYGEVVTISDAVTGDPVWELTVEAPVDVTVDLAAEDLFNPTPESGTYTGIPVTLTYIGLETVDPWIDYEWNVAVTWVTAGGTPLEQEYLILPDGYVGVTDLDAMSHGETVTFHTIVDARTDTAGSVRTTIGYDYDLYWAAPV